MGELGSTSDIRSDSVAPASSYRTQRSLLAACRRGEREAWEELLGKYRRLVYSVPLACGLSSDAADDVFQRVSLKLVEHVGRIRDADALASWLVVTARRESWAQARAAGRSAELDPEAAERLVGEDPELERELHLLACEHALAVALEELGEPCRSLLRALYLEEPPPSYQELAERLGRPIGSLGPTRARCLKKLRTLYERAGGTAPFGVGEEP